MRPNRSLEIGTGFFVLLGFAALAFLSTQLPGTGIKFGADTSGYELSAKFDNVGDLKVGSPVSMAGVHVGRVTGVSIDPVEYRAVVTMIIDKNFDKIPDDSWASIETAGLLGAKYVGLEARGSETYFKDKGEIENTQGAMVLEKLVNKMFAAVADRAGGTKNDAPEAGAEEKGK
ncbi:MAG: outer membrane lipid asymmetry maintenance protein MlaD [Steroidobacteraceae bacterium]